MIVDFTATWCGPCQQIKPLYHQLAIDYPNIIFTAVDVDDNEDTASAAGVSAMPTFQFYKNGIKVGELMGANPDKLKAKIDELK